MTVQKLENMGLSPGLSSFALMLFAIGITTFYFLPLAFVFQQIGLFLGILNGILLGILLGLSLLSQMIQPLAEQFLLQITFATIISKNNQCLQPIVRKNLFGHRSRNRKVAYVLTIAVAFLIFAGALFSLQARVIGVSVSQLLGADISMSAFRTGNEKDEAGLPILNGLPELELNQVLNVTGNGVESWTYITYHLRDLPFVQDTRIGPSSMSPNRRSNIFGIQTNFLDVAYKDYVVITGRNIGGIEKEGEGGDIVKEMIQGKGNIVLMGEKRGAGGDGGVDGGGEGEEGDGSMRKKLDIVATSKGNYPTCGTILENGYIFLQCINPNEIITDIMFARYGTPTGVCDESSSSSSSSSSSTLAASDRCDAGNYVRQYFTAKCVGRSSCGAQAKNNLFSDPCPGTAKWLTVDAICGTNYFIHFNFLIFFFCSFTNFVRYRRCDP